MSHLASNLRRVMAREGLTIDDVVRRAGLDERTIKSLLRGDQHRPHARTLHALAAGLDVSADEFFQNPAVLAHRLFDRRTNPAVEEVIAAHPQHFDGWTSADFDELHSHFAAGGALTESGALMVAEQMNNRRAIQSKVALLLETHEADLLANFIDLLYARVVITAPTGAAECSTPPTPIARPEPVSDSA